MTAAPVTRLRIATLNCLNLALPARPVYDGWPPYTADEYLAKTQWLAALLDRLAADFVLLQEVFHEQALSDVVRQTVSQGRGWSFAAPHAGQDNRKPRVALAWRTQWQPALESIIELPPGCAVPVPEHAEHRAFSRPPLRARVPLTTPRGPLTLSLFNVHLKSRRPEYVPGEDPLQVRDETRAQLRALLMRAAEAAGLRQLVTADLHSARGPLVVAGDFNDSANAVTTQMVADTSCKPEEGGAREHTLFNAVDLVAQRSPGGRHEMDYTILHGGAPERIDHVLVSEEFAAGLPRAIGQVVAVQVFNDHLSERRRPAAAGADEIDLGRVLSDHAAVCVTLAFDV